MYIESNVTLPPPGDVVAHTVGSATGFWGRGPGFASGISHNDPSQWRELYGVKQLLKSKFTTVQYRMSEQNTVKCYTSECLLLILSLCKDDPSLCYYAMYCVYRW